MQKAQPYPFPGPSHGRFPRSSGSHGRFPCRSSGAEQPPRLFLPPAAAAHPLGVPPPLSSAPPPPSPSPAWAAGGRRAERRHRRHSGRRAPPKLRCPAARRPAGALPPRSPCGHRETPPRAAPCTGQGPAADGEGACAGKAVADAAFDAAMEDSPLVWAPPAMVAKMVGFLVDGEEQMAMHPFPATTKRKDEKIHLPV